MTWQLLHFIWQVPLCHKLFRAPSQPPANCDYRPLVPVGSENNVALHVARRVLSYCIVQTYGKNDSIIQKLYSFFEFDKAITNILSCAREGHCMSKKFVISLKYNNKLFKLWNWKCIDVMVWPVKSGKSESKMIWGIIWGSLV